jgi:hypothetical protein
LADFENIAINITAAQLENVASKDIVNVVDETASDNEIPTALAVKNAISTSGGGGGAGVIDQTYNPTSKNAQSGVAVAEAIEQTVGDINTVLSSVVEGVVTDEN